MPKTARSRIIEMAEAGLPAYAISKKVRRTEGFVKEVTAQHYGLGDLAEATTRVKQVMKSEHLSRDLFNARLALNKLMEFTASSNPIEITPAYENVLIALKGVGLSVALISEWSGHSEGELKEFFKHN